MGGGEERCVGGIRVYKGFSQDGVEDGMGEGAMKVFSKG